MNKFKRESTKDRESECIRTCLDLFGPNYSAEIIETICQHTNYDIDATIERIITMQSDTVETTPSTDTKTKAELENYQPSHPTGAISKLQMAPPSNMNFSAKLRNNNNPFATSNYTTQRRRIPDANNNQSGNFESICALIKQNLKVLVVMRGLPGSGKSTMARNILNVTLNTDGVNPTNHILSADDYFVDRYGRYVYAREKIGEAHEFTQNRALKRMQEGWSPIIVDNTTMKVWEMIPYIKMAVTYGYVIKILEPNTPWARKPHILAKKNTHEVPETTLRRMLESYEPAQLKEILKSLQLDYHMQVKPSLRTHPAPWVEETTPSVEAMEVTEGAAIVQSDLFSFGQSLPIDWAEKQANKDELTSRCSLSSIPLPKPPRFAHLTPALRPTTDNEQRTTTRTNTTVDWQPHEREPTDAWSTPVIAPIEKAETPQPRRDPPKVSQNMDPFDLTDVKPALAKHRTGCSNENASFVMLRTIYPTLPVIYLWDLFVNCNGDIEWTMDILLKDKSTMDFLSDDSQPVHGSADYEISCDCSKVGGEASAYLVQPVETRTQSPAMKQVKREKAHPTAVDKQALRAIEQNFVIGDEHYSDQLKKVRNFRHGQPPQKTPPSVVAATVKSPVTSEEDEETEEIVEIELGLGLVTRLEGLFGAELTEQNMDALRLKTNVFMTKSLANQLYALWRESLYNQLEEQRIKSLKEDEEFARQLHAQEKYPLLHQQEEPKNLKDRMEMEAALESYRDEVKRGWQDALSNDMAAQMTREKLFKLFPNVDPETLVEILAAHEGRFEETIVSLGHSLNGQDLREKLPVTTKDLFEAARKESILIETAEATNNIFVDTPDKDKVLNADEAKKAALKDFEECRNSAAYHSQLKSECYLKAKNAVARGENGVALYYSQIANLHKSKIDQYNHKAANCIMEVHSLRQNNPDMLDLHYLHLAEAVQCLDLFLDEHITNLKSASSNNKNLFVITGRGLHSAGGIPTVKLRVKQHLAARGLRFSEVNPGLLKVKIYANSVYSQ